MVTRKPTHDRLGQLTDALERADVHGRGGGGFPTATKLRAVAAQRGRPIVVVNAAEGEPLSQKDHYLLTGRVNTVLDGAHAAADALSADAIIIAVDQGLSGAADTVGRAVQTRRDLNRRGLKTTVQLIPSGYVTGQETALIASLAGGEAKPTLTPPYPFERGLRGRPTLVSNTETFSHIGRVARGSYDGSRLVTVGGAVSEPGLVEITADTTMTGLLNSVGGLTESVSGVLLGGYAGTWASMADVVPLGLDERVLRERHLTLGAGIVFLLGESACPVAEVAGVAKWMAAESARQCGPCIHGLSAIATALQELTSRGDRFATYGQIRRWSELVQKRGACAHPDGVARFVTTALDVFTAEFDDHARHGACERCAVSAALPLPRRRRDRTLIRASRHLTRDAAGSAQGVLG
jgi:NADH:ubiquinone oxidoreductase subunit F (NADH-binding)